MDPVCAGRQCASAAVRLGDRGCRQPRTAIPTVRSSPSTHEVAAQQAPSGRASPAPRAPPSRGVEAAGQRQAVGLALRAVHERAADLLLGQDSHRSDRPSQRGEDVGRRGRHDRRAGRLELTLRGRPPSGADARQPVGRGAPDVLGPVADQDRIRALRVAPRARPPRPRPCAAPRRRAWRRARSRTGPAVRCASRTRTAKTSGLLVATASTASRARSSSSSSGMPG